DQFYDVQVHVTAAADSDPTTLLVDDTFNVSRYEAVVDPAAPSLNTLFLKTLANGSVTRHKEFDYHLPTLAFTTFTGNGASAGIFNFGTSFAGDGKAAWTFTPSGAATWTSPVDI